MSVTFFEFFAPNFLRTAPIIQKFYSQGPKFEKDKRYRKANLTYNIEVSYLKNPKTLIIPR